MVTMMEVMIMATTYGALSSNRYAKPEVDKLYNEPKNKYFRLCGLTVCHRTVKAATNSV